MQTLQDFIDEDLPLFYYTCPRSIVQTFLKQHTSATARLVFDYLMLNYSRKLNHTHKVENTEIANWIEVSEGNIRRQLAHLKKIGVIQPHPDKISVYLIPALAQLRNDLHNYRLSVKENNLQKQIAQRISEMEFDLERKLSEKEKKRIDEEMRRDAKYKERSRKKRQEQENLLNLPFTDE